MKLSTRQIERPDAINGRLSKDYTRILPLLRSAAAVKGLAPPRSCPPLCRDHDGPNRTAASSRDLSQTIRARARPNGPVPSVRSRKRNYAGQDHFDHHSQGAKKAEIASEARMVFAVDHDPT